MKQIVRYRCLSIAGKLTIDIRITIDDRAAEYTSLFDGNKSTGISFFPLISLSLTKPVETDDNGNRIKPPWNPNDNLGMTKFNLPIFYNELRGIREDMKTPDLYTYHGKRLELNEEVAAKIRRVFIIGNTTIELSAVVVVNPNDDSRLEGIKIKFNNEQSTVLLTINEVDSLLYNIDHLDIDSIAFMMYLNYINRPDKPKNFDAVTLNTKIVDIKPKTEEFPSESF